MIDSPDRGRRTRTIQSHALQDFASSHMLHLAISGREYKDDGDMNWRRTQQSDSNKVDIKKWCSMFDKGGLLDWSTHM